MISYEELLAQINNHECPALALQELLEEWQHYGYQEGYQEGRMNGLGDPY